MAIASITSKETRHRAHRFFEEAPTMITVPLAELLDRLPVLYRKEAPADQTRGRLVELPCSDLLAGNMPRLSLGQMNDLLPDLVIVPEGGDRSQPLNLPAGWLALHYRLVTRFEEIVPEKQNAPTLVTPLAAPLPAEESAKKTAPVRVIEAEVIVTTKAEDASAMEKSTMETPSALNEHPDKVKQIGEMKGGNKATAPKNESQQPEIPEVVPSAAPKRGFFASLPIFRRNVNSKAAAQERGLVVVPTDSTDAPKPLSLKSLEPLTPLWKLDPLDQLADPAALQALFMTEEQLTLDRVIAMAGQLPGLRACILAHGNQVVCASNTPPGVDLQNLSGQAMTMLAQIRESSSKMGLGNVPGVTLHADQGALSFVHNKELCLLVLHSDRGFLPGVRERLQEMLGHLAHAEALSSGPSAQTSLPI